MAVKWVGKSYLLCDRQTRWGQHRIPVLTLDDLETWLTDEEKSRIWKTPDQVFSNLLAQVRGVEATEQPA